MKAKHIRDPQEPMVTLCGQLILSAPAGTITINGNSRLTGRVECDRLVINSGGVLQAATP